MFSDTYSRLLLYMGHVRADPRALGLLKSYLTSFCQVCLVSTIEPSVFIGLFPNEVYMFSYTYSRLLLYMGRVCASQRALGLLKSYLTSFCQLGFVGTIRLPVFIGLLKN